MSHIQSRYYAVKVGMAQKVRWPESGLIPVGLLGQWGNIMGQVAGNRSSSPAVDRPDERNWAGYAGAFFAETGIFFKKDVFIQQINSSEL